ncbi:hypothetical protein Btru_063825 [Bulinus truncatus]|nr:hypothetical protein Btru_063825 [Bulinus truncatus]
MFVYSVNRNVYSVNRNVYSVNRNVYSVYGNVYSVNGNVKSSTVSRHQASEMTNALKAKVKSAATLLQQRKILQRNLRSLQQHSLSREILSNYRSRQHSLPTPDDVKSMSPYINERMRKRRCFADKELEMVMMERERRAEMTFHQNNLLARTVQPPPTPLELTKSRMFMTPREMLHRVFPNHSPSLLELVWQGSGGHLERAIEQLAAGMKCTLGHLPAAVQQPILTPILSASFPQSQATPPSMFAHVSDVTKMFSMFPFVVPSYFMTSHVLPGDDSHVTDSEDDSSSDRCHTEEAHGVPLVTSPGAASPRQVRLTSDMSCHRVKSDGELESINTTRQEFTKIFLYDSKSSQSPPNEMSSSCSGDRNRTNLSHSCPDKTRESDQKQTTKDKTPFLKFSVEAIMSKT